MKKIIALLLAALLFCCALPALADGPLTALELQYFWDGLLETALDDEPVSPEQDEDGLFTFEFGSFALTCAERQLTPDSEIMTAEMRGGILLIEDMRGISLGSTVEEVLAAYPLDNAALAGTYDEAALYIGGMLPDAVNCGRMMRSGAEVTLIEHDALIPDGGGVEQYYVCYTFDGGVVTGIQTGRVRQNLEDAQDEIDALSALQEQRAYIPYAAETPGPLAREDLMFVGRKGALDFLSAGEKELTALLGEPQADNWDAEDGAYIRTMEWEGVTAVLAYDADRETGVLAGLQVYGDQLEGPRSLHMNDTMGGVLARFPEEAAPVEGGQAEPYGLMSNTEDGLTVEYTVALEKVTVALDLDFVDDALWVMTCVYKEIAD